MSNNLKNKQINSILIRTTDESLTDEQRINKIKKIKNNKDLIIELRYNPSGTFEIIYPLRTNDNLPSMIASNLEQNKYSVEKYYSQRLPSNPSEDYYKIISQTIPNETIIIYLNDLINYQNIMDIIANTIEKYLNKNITYKVVSGDTLYKIAQKYKTTVEDIKKLNNLSNNQLKINTILKIPSPTTNEEEVSTNENIYIVKKGDTLYKIANSYNISIDELIKENNIKGTKLQVGDKLTIPPKETYTTYLIKKGDTLYAIAKNNNTTVEDIKKLNNLNDNILTIGTSLKIPK